MWVVVDVKLVEITSIDWPQMSNLPVMKKTKCEKFSWTYKHELTKDNYMSDSESKQFIYEVTLTLIKQITHFC